MSKILITGATGNVGLEVIRSLSILNHSAEVIAGVRDLAQANAKLSTYDVQLVKFDFKDITTYKPALAGCNVVFLLRPPEIADVKKLFNPLIDSAKACGIKHIVFLSVQGAQTNRFIPHHKIEKLIAASGIPYTFLRPAYYFQNFTGNLLSDLKYKRKIFLPAGKVRFSLIDVRDIAKVTVMVLLNTDNFINQSFDLTNNEKLTFGEMAQMLSSGLNRTIKYESPGLFKFYWVKRKEKMSRILILVMIMLHYLPRFSKEPSISPWVKQIAKDEPITFCQYIKDNKKILAD